MYSCCSASLLLMNKMVIAVIPLHSYVTSFYVPDGNAFFTLASCPAKLLILILFVFQVSCAQFLFASVCVVVFKLCGWIELNYFNPEAVSFFVCEKRKALFFLQTLFLGKELWFLKLVHFSFLKISQRSTRAKNDAHEIHLLLQKVCLFDFLASGLS